MKPLSGLLLWAFSAGMVATLNPCGFALLPAYVSYVIGRAGEEASLTRALIGGAAAGFGMTAGVLAVFLAAGSLVSAAGAAITRYIPWLGFLIGALVITVGILMLLRRAWVVALPITNPLARSPALLGTGVRAYFLFGAGYGLASLGCTLPIFLVVTMQALAAGGFVPGLAVFLAYGLGIGLVLLALSVTAGAGKGIVVATLRRGIPLVRTAGAIGMVAAGSYLIYYQLTVSRYLISR